MMSKSLSFYVQRYFSSYLIRQNNYGRNTLSSYRDTFKLLLTYLDKCNMRKKNILIADINKPCVLDFLEWLTNSRGNSASTRNVRLAHLKSFFHFTRIESPELADQCESVMSIPFTDVEKRPPEYMTEDSVSHLLHSIDTGSKEGLRHLAILSLLYDSGCRVQELIDLKVQDIQLEKGQRMFVHGKGNKYREIPIMPDTGKIIRKYIKVFSLTAQDQLFANKQGKPLTRQGIRYILQKYALMAKKDNPGDFDGQAHPHLLRHSKATHLVNSGVNIYNIRDFLGHSSVNTTQVYLASNPEVTRKVIETVASQTVTDSAAYFSETEKQALMDYLETLI